MLQNPILVVKAPKMRSLIWGFRALGFRVPGFQSSGLRVSVEIKRKFHRCGAAVGKLLSACSRYGETQCKGRAWGFRDQTFTEVEPSSAACLESVARRLGFG